MWKQLTSRRRASAFARALFFIGLAALAFTGAWWPNLALVIGIPLTLKHFLLGRSSDMILSMLVFGGIFVTYQYDINWQVLLPVLFVVAATYVLFREFTTRQTIAEEEVDINIEIEEEQSED